MRWWVLLCLVLSGCDGVSGEERDGCLSAAELLYVVCELGPEREDPAEVADLEAAKCIDAMKVDGEAAFDPMKTPASDESIRLTNNAEAQKWVDCVEHYVRAGDPGTCANVDPYQGGVCAPVAWN